MSDGVKRVDGKEEGLTKLVVPSIGLDHQLYRTVGMARVRCPHSTGESALIWMVSPIQVFEGGGLTNPCGLIRDRLASVCLLTDATVLASKAFAAERYCLALL